MQFQNNPIRGRFNSWLLEKFEDDIHEEMGDRKREHLRSFKGLVVEIGAGNGVNFRYYPPSLRVVVYEPNPYMHDRLHKAARAHDIDYELRAESAEKLDFDDESVDAVACTLVLCTVPDPVRVIREVHRVLKPDGRFFFMEHVAAEDGRILHNLQNLLMRPWRWLFEGCHTNRRTDQLLQEGGFSHLDIESFHSDKMPPVIVPMICGTAIK